MSIQVTCQCGKVHTVPDSAAGRMGTCNECGGRMRIPDGSTQQPAQSSRKGGPRVRESTASAESERPAKKKNGGGCMGLIIIACILSWFTKLAPVGIAVLLLVVCYVVWASFRD